MSSTVTMPPASVDSPNQPPARGWSSLWGRLSLGIIILVSIFMNFYQLGQNGYGNSYYAAGVKSMGDSLHNFFFVAFDPGAFVTIDKPPLGFWLQVISTKIFGFTAFSIFLPQALAGVISVWLLYMLVKRHFGVTAGLIAAFALAASPISVVTNRNNTIDSTLTLVMLLGAWAVMKAAESGKLRWLLMTAVLVGIGFNIKMMEAYLVVPAYGLLYVMSAPRTIWTRIWHLAVAVLVMVVISFSWVLAVDLIPAVLRPYVGSTQNNSEISLAIGYNGVSRLLGNSIGGGGGGGAGGAGSFGTGIPGVLRLFEAQLGSQIAWLLPFALLAIVALAWQRRWRFRDDPQQQSMLLWGAWLLTMGVFFSVAGFFHQYYLSVMAPSICALFGIGVVVMWNDYRRRGWRGWLLPIALILTAAEQIYIIHVEPAWGTWLIPVIAAACGVAMLTLIIARLVPGIIRGRRRGPGLLKGMVVLALIGLLLTPFIWSAAPGVQNVAQNLPSAGPSGEGGFGGGGGQGNTTDTALIKYLEAHQGSAKYLVATSSSNSADAIILATNKPVMALGGFSGSDPILTTAQLQALIKNGTVRYFLPGGAGGGTGARAGGFNSNDLPAQVRKQIAAQGGNGAPPNGTPPTGGFGGGGSNSNQGTLTDWVMQNCKVVSISSSSSSSSSSQGSSQLYDCAATK